jgi:Tfp pilus assembly major pilin PilA
MKCLLNKLRYQDQKGAVLIEFAFVAIILLILFATIVELSLLLYNKNVLDNASRVGARAMIVAGATAVEDKIVEYCEGPDKAGRLINLVDGHVAAVETALTITITEPDPDKDIVVSVKYQHPFMLVNMMDALLGMIGAGPIDLENVTIKGITVMRTE